MISGKNIRKTGILFVLVLILDAITKWWVQAFLPKASAFAFYYPYSGIGVFKNFLGIEFSIIHETNKGAAWGSFSEYQNYLLVFRIVLIVGLLFYMLFTKQEKLLTPLTLVLAGAIGNVADFFIYGHVIDMIHFKFGSYDYPIFNVADCAIFIGVVWLAIYSLFGSATTKKARAR